MLLQTLFPAHECVTSWTISYLTHMMQITPGKRKACTKILMPSSKPLVKESEPVRVTRVARESCKKRRLGVIVRQRTALGASPNNDPCRTPIVAPCDKAHDLTGGAIVEARQMITFNSEKDQLVWLEGSLGKHRSLREQSRRTNGSFNAAQKQKIERFPVDSPRVPNDMVVLGVRLLPCVHVQFFWVTTRVEDGVLLRNHFYLTRASTILQTCSIVAVIVSNMYPTTSKGRAAQPRAASFQALENSSISECKHNWPERHSSSSLYRSMLGKRLYATNEGMSLPQPASTVSHSSEKNRAQRAASNVLSSKPQLTR